MKWSIEWANPFILHTPLVEDFEKVYLRGSVNFQKHLPLCVFLDWFITEGVNFLYGSARMDLSIWIYSPHVFFTFHKLCTEFKWTFPNTHPCQGQPWIFLTRLPALWRTWLLLWIHPTLRYPYQILECHWSVLFVSSWECWCNWLLPLHRTVRIDQSEAVHAEDTKF